MFVYLLLLFLMCVIPLCFMEERNKRTVVIYASAVFILFLFAGLRPIGVDKDSLNYLSLYSGEEVEMIEPSFFMVCRVVDFLFGEPRMLFVTYAFLGVFLRGYSLMRLTNLWFLSLLVWMSYFFIMQDLTQIRIGLSSAIFLFSIPYLSERKYLWFIGFVLLATFFHYSALVLLVLLFLTNKPLARLGRCVLAAAPVVAYACYFLKLDFVMMLPIPYVQDKLDVYEVMRDIGLAGDEINVFNIPFLMKMMVFYLLLWKWDIVAATNKYFPLLMKVECLSLCAFVALAFLPVLSFRISELLGVVEIALIPHIIYTVKPRPVGVMLVAVYAVGVFLINVYYNQFLSTV